MAERLYTGKNSGFMRTRRIIFAAVTSGGTIVEARIMRTAFIFIPAKAANFDIIKNKNIFRLDPSSFDITPTEKKALINLVKDAQKRQ